MWGGGGGGGGEGEIEGKLYFAFVVAIGSVLTMIGSVLTMGGGGGGAIEGKLYSEGM